MARMDVVVTTRLHGIVLTLKKGVSALVVNPIAGGSTAMRDQSADRLARRLTAIDDAELNRALSTV
jgi:polysaccharide pyruvyl transferase WcaK-like protein